MTAGGSIREVESVASTYLAAYCAPGSPYAWPAYDFDPNPGRLVPTDVLAPAFLSYPIKGTYLNEMFRQPDDVRSNPYANVLSSLTAAVEENGNEPLAFEAMPVSALRDRTRLGWGSVLRALDAAQDCKGVTSVAITKVLHRKLPQLVPVNDSRVRSFYGVNDGYASLFERIHADLNANGSLLDKWREPYTCGDQQPMTRLRALDIVIWMHMAPGA